jgi:hypothetical protein
MSQLHNPYPPVPPPLPPAYAAGPALGPSQQPGPAAGRFDHPLEPAFEPHHERAPRARRNRSPVSLGAALWGVAAVTAVAYLAVVLLRPDLVARIDTGARSAVAEIETLRGEVDGLRRDVADIRTTVTEATSQQKVIFERLAALGAPMVQPIPASDPNAAPPALRLDSAPVNAPLSPRADVSAALTQPVTPPASAAKRIADAKILNAKPALETGSVKPAPATTPQPAATPAATPAAAPPFGAPVVTPAAKPVGVQIASGSSLDSLKLSWNLLSETHADKFKNLEPRYSLSVDGSTVVYNLMAGPVKSEAEARKMCKALVAKAVPCKIVGEFGGAAL